MLIWKKLFAHLIISQLLNIFKICFWKFAHLLIFWKFTQFENLKICSFWKFKNLLIWKFTNLLIWKYLLIYLKISHLLIWLLLPLFDSIKRDSLLSFAYFLFLNCLLSYCLFLNCLLFYCLFLNCLLFYSPLIWQT